MRTRLVRVRRERPSGVIWALSFLLLSLALYLLTNVPDIKSALSVMGGETSPPAEKNESQPRVTQEVRFPAEAYFLIQFSAFDSLENARIEAARYVKRGAAGYVLQDGTYRVIGAGYADESEVKRVKDKLLDQEKMDCVVYPLSAPEIVLRVTATQGQIDALIRAETVLADLTGALSDIAYRLDGGALDADGAKMEMSSLKSTVNSALLQLESQTGEVTNDVALGLIDILRGADDALGLRISGNDESVLLFSSKIKYNTIDIRVRHIRYLQALAM